MSTNTMDAIALCVARKYGRDTWAQTIAVRLVRNMGPKPAAMLVRAIAKRMPK